MSRDVLEEKDMLELFNYISTDDKEGENIDLKVDDLKKKRLRKNLLKQVKDKKSVRKYKYKAAAAVVIVVISIGAAVPALAKNIPALKSIIQALNSRNDDHGEYEKYSQMLNKSVTDKGITLTINEVLCDESNLMIGYTIKSEGNIKEIVKMGKDVIEAQGKANNFQPFMLIGYLKINGKQVDSGSGEGGKYLDDHSYINSETMNIANKNLPSIFNVDLDIKDICGVQGKWNFKFSVSKDEILKKTKVFKPNTTVKFPDATINVEKVSFTPINTSIMITGKYNKEEYKDAEKRKEAFKQDVMIGNMIYDNWFVFDDKGEELITKGSSGGRNEQSPSSDFNYEFRFVSSKDIPKYLTVIPYRINYNNDNYEKYKAADGSISIPAIYKNINGDYPIELSQGKMGKLIVKEINIEKDKTVVKYTAEGSAPFLQAKMLFILDENEKAVEPKDNFNVKRDKNNPNDYIMEFEPLDKNTKYKIGTNDLGYYEIRNDLKLRIELNK